MAKIAPSAGTRKSSELDLSRGEYVSITISDTGTGMPGETMEKVFEPFFTTKDVGQGSGLGLSMVYGFIKQSGGDVIIDSTEDVGTTVTMYLPKSLEKKDGAFSIEEGNEPRTRGEKILVVEDNDEVRSLTVRLLNDLGYNTVDVDDGAAAVSALKNSSDFDLLFSDIMLPGGMNGHEIAREANQRFPHMAILLMSGYAFREDIEIDASALKSEILMKPYRRIELAVKIRSVLDTAAPG